MLPTCSRRNNPCEECRQAHAEATGHAGQRAEFQVVLGTLDAANVGPVQIGAFGELLL